MRVHITNNLNPSRFRFRTCSHFCPQPRPLTTRDREALRSVGGMCSELNVVSASSRAPSAGPEQDEAVVVIVVAAAAPVLHVEKDDRCSSSSSSAV